MQSDILVSLAKFLKSPMLLFSLVKKNVFFFDISTVVLFLWQLDSDILVILTQHH
jgi:hypothetical protein